MKTINIPTMYVRTIVLTLTLLLLCNVGFAQIFSKGNPDKPETEIIEDIIWQVKAYRPDAMLLRVKAIDKDGTIYDIKAIQDSDDTSVLNVKALVNGERLPVKLLTKTDEPYYPVKAIKPDGTIMDVKALTEDGTILDIKGVSRSGNVIHIRAIDKDMRRYNIIAVSPFGVVNQVKGVKMLDQDVETVINGVTVYAHIKAMQQDYH